MNDHIFIPTAEQIKQAQEAGNAAYDAIFDTHGKWNLRSATEAYRAAYDATMLRFENEAKRAYIPLPHVTLAEAQPVADAMTARYQDWQDERGAGNSAETQDMIEMTARAFEEQPPIEY
jgi:hypothetical protein